MLIFKGLNFGIDFTGRDAAGAGASPGVSRRPKCRRRWPQAAALSQPQSSGSYVQPVEEAVEGQSVVMIRTKAFDGDVPIE